MYSACVCVCAFSGGGQAPHWQDGALVGVGIHMQHANASMSCVLSCLLFPSPLASSDRHEGNESSESSSNDGYEEGGEGHDGHEGHEGKACDESSEPAYRLLLPPLWRTGVPSAFAGWDQGSLHVL